MMDGCIYLIYLMFAISIAYFCHVGLKSDTTLSVHTAIPPDRSHVVTGPLLYRNITPHAIGHVRRCDLKDLRLSGC